MRIPCLRLTGLGCRGSLSFLRYHVFAELVLDDFVAMNGIA
jgi:hypothetical protein